MSEPKGAYGDMTTKYNVLPWMQSRDRARTLEEKKKKKKKTTKEI